MEHKPEVPVHPPSPRTTSDTHHSVPVLLSSTEEFFYIINYSDFSEVRPV